jgi:hypothetical protein
MAGRKLVLLVGAALLQAASSFVAAPSSTRRCMFRQSSSSSSSLAMSAAAYDVTITKPMGLVFEENDPQFKGVYVKEVRCAVHMFPCVMHNALLVASMHFVAVCMKPPRVSVPLIAV